MDKKYLDKVVDKIVSETDIDYKVERIYFPVPSRLFTSFSIFNQSFLPPSTPSPSYFSKYYKNQFGLTKDEVIYVWNEYKRIINDKIKG